MGFSVAVVIQILIPFVYQRDRVAKLSVTSHRPNIYWLAKQRVLLFIFLYIK